MTCSLATDPFIPRPQVAAFASLMEEKLRQNDEKGGWAGCKPKWLLARACEEMVELVETIAAPDPPREPTREKLFLAAHHLRLAAQCLNGIGPYVKLKARDSASSEAADVANFLMMFIDVLKQLPKESDDEREPSA